MSGKEAVKRWRAVVEEMAFNVLKNGGDDDAVFREWMPKGWQQMAREAAKSGLLEELEGRSHQTSVNRAKAILETAFPQDGE